MADFMQAVEWMREGKKVTRKRYSDNVYFRFDGDELEMLNHDNYAFAPTQESLLATDWEIYEEDKDWNLADKHYGYKNPKITWEFKQPDIKKCRDLIIKDMAKKTFSCHGDFIEIVEKRFGDL